MNHFAVYIKKSIIFVKFILANMLLVTTSFTLAQSGSTFLATPKNIEKISIKLAYVHNEDFPALDDKNLIDIIAEAKKIANNNFKIDIDFVIEKNKIEIEKLFKKIPDESFKIVQARIFDFKSGSGDLNLLINNTKKQIAINGGNFNEIKNFAKPYINFKSDFPDMDEFAESLVEEQLIKIDKWKKEKTGKSFIIDGKPYNEYTYWIMLGGTDLPYELILTNQIIASVEYFGNEVHSAIRGGLSNGFTAPNIKSKTGLMSIVSLFPFMAKDLTTLSLRDGPFVNQKELNIAIAALIIHELGHQIFHFGHPFGNSACIMTPPVLLKFKTWISMLDPEKCPLNSNKMMSLGALKFYDVRSQKTYEENR